MGYELVDLEMSPRSRLLRVFIDQPGKQGGVDVDDCAMVSNQLTRVLSVENIDYDRLEVSSPGLDRVLTKEGDFTRFAGNKVKLRLKVPLNERRNFQGLLLGLRGDKVAVSCQGEEYIFEINNITKANLVPDFDKQKKVIS